VLDAVTSAGPAVVAGRPPAVLDAGLDVQAAAVVEDAGSLQEMVTSCTWEVEVTGVAPEELAERVEAALAADSLVISRERKGKASEDDVRPGISSCAVDGLRLVCELAAHPRTLRPSELLLALRPGLIEGRVLRTAQWIWRDDARREPVATARPLREDPDVRRRFAAAEQRPHALPGAAFAVSS